MHKHYNSISIIVFNISFFFFNIPFNIRVDLVCFFISFSTRRPMVVAMRIKKKKNKAKCARDHRLTSAQCMRIYASLCVCVCCENCTFHIATLQRWLPNRFLWLDIISAHPIVLYFSRNDVYKYALFIHTWVNIKKMCNVGIGNKHHWCDCVHIDFLFVLLRIICIRLTELINIQFR